MDNDLISSLTCQIREDVIQNYLTERRLIRLQMEEIANRAEGMKSLARRTGLRLNRLVHLMIHPEMVSKLYALLSIPQSSFWNECSREEFFRGVRFIRVRALTDRGKFRKLVSEAYHRLYRRTERYREAYEEMTSQCRAVNSNIKHFQQNFDVLSMLSFLKSLDSGALERKHFLGENFTAEELASVDQTLYIGTIPFETLEIPIPLDLPKPESVEYPMTELANEVYGKYRKSVQRLLDNPITPTAGMPGPDRHHPVGDMKSYNERESHG
jgi:hypothetical protein